MKKKILAALLVVTTMLFASACTTDNSAAQKGDGTGEVVTEAVNSDDAISEEDKDAGTADNEEATDTAEADNTSADNATGNNEVVVEEVEKTWYEEMLDASIKFKGNNYRLKKVLEKARSGETVNVCALGGSITEGAGATTNDQGYAYQFADNFKNTYCSGDNLNFVNAGLSGTPSALGVMRYQRDVVEALGAVPDLLIIEFAVNDWQEATGYRAFESLIYRALTDNEECAVIILYSSSKGKWNLQNDMNPYAMYYGVPAVSVLDAITSTTEVSDNDYFSDEYHPKTYGHTIMSDCLMNLLATVDKADENTPLAVPDNAKKGREFANMTLIDSTTTGISIDKGAFNGTDGTVQTSYKKGSCFPNNFYKDGSTGGPLKITLTCKTLLLDFKTANDGNFGTAEVYVDGVLVATLNGNSSGGWNNNNVVLIIDEKEAASHTVEVKMAAGSESKKFTVLSLAYN